MNNKPHLTRVFTTQSASWNIDELQTWDSILGFLSNCWMLLIGFLQGSAVKLKFWTFFLLSYLLQELGVWKLDFFIPRFRPPPPPKKKKKKKKKNENWGAEFLVYFDRPSDWW